MTRSVDRAYFVSDVHLSGPGERLDAFVSFVRGRVHADRGAALIVAGDLFDFVHGGMGAVPAPLAGVVDALSEAPSLWLEGNHDLLPEGLGTSIQVVPSPLRLRIGGRAIRVEHGDLIDRADHSYRLLRALLRSTPATLAARWLGPERAAGLGNLFAKGRRRGDMGYDGRDPAWLAAALRHASGIPANETLVLGHGHWLGFWACPRLVCLGDWLRYRSYLRVDAGDVALCTWDGAERVLTRVATGAMP
jgi:UDP-2,3-diacylglucosamine hydrolase